MAAEKTQNAELTIEYHDYDEYDVAETTIEATITVDGDAWIVDGDGFAEPQEFRVVEERDKIMVAPVFDYGLSTTQIAEYVPGTDRIEPTHFKHQQMYVSAIVGDVIDQTLGTMVTEAREEFVSERGIESATHYDIPDINVEVREGQPLFPSSKIGQTLAPRNRLVVEPLSDLDCFQRWQNAIVTVANRYEVYAGTPSEDTDELLAPNRCETGNVLTLTEYLDAYYTIDPAAVVEAVVPQETVDKQAKREEKRKALESAHPELRHVNISNLDAFEDADDTGELVEIADRTDSCNDPQRQCDIDLVALYATPDGTIEKDRVHTY